VKDALGTRSFRTRQESIQVPGTSGFSEPNTLLRPHIFRTGRNFEICSPDRPLEPPITSLVRLRPPWCTPRTVTGNVHTHACAEPVLVRAPTGILLLNTADKAAANVRRRTEKAVVTSLRQERVIDNKAFWQPETALNETGEQRPLGRLRKTPAPKGFQTRSRAERQPAKSRTCLQDTTSS
jgi:hypothetical protein